MTPRIDLLIVETDSGELAQSDLSKQLKNFSESNECNNTLIWIRKLSETRQLFLRER